MVTVTLLTMISEPTSVNDSLNILSLPLEIREWIWELSVTSEEQTIEVERIKENGESSVFATAQQPPITRTCRQSRSESLPLFYTRNHFRIDLAIRDVFHTYNVEERHRCCFGSKWIKAIGTHNAKLLRDVEWSINTGKRGLFCTTTSKMGFCNGFGALA